MPFISQRSLIFAYFYIATALPPFVTLSLLLISVISFELFLLISIFLDMHVSIFLIILSIFMFGCFYFSRFFYLTCCDLTVSLPLSLSLLILLPHSLTMYLSQNTKISIYLYLLLHLTFTLRIAIILLLFLHISLSLTHFQSLWRNLLRYFSLCL